MMHTMKTGLPIDTLISHEGGIPSATNIMCIGDPGIGQNHCFARFDFASAQNKGAKCLFISGEMG